MYCSTCFDFGDTNCAGCNVSFNTFVTGFNEDFGDICSDECLERNFDDCNHCGRIELRANLVRDETRETINSCQDCYRNRRLRHDALFGFITSTEKDKLDTKDFTVGIELETLNKLDKKEYRSFNMSPQDVDYFLANVNAKGDGSIGDDEGTAQGVEFTTNPTSNNATYDMISKVTTALKSNGFVANKTCGFHVHLGGEKLHSAKNRHKILLVYSMFHDSLFDMLPPSRRQNAYCDRSWSTFPNNWKHFLKLVADDPESIFTNEYGRYNAINFCSYPRRQTLEVRCHSGTVEFEEVIKWIQINVAMFDFAIHSSYKDLLELRGSNSEFKKLVLVTKDLIEYYNYQTKRYAKLLPTGQHIKFHPKKQQIKTVIKKKLTPQVIESIKSSGNVFITELANQIPPLNSI